MLRSLHWFGFLLSLRHPLAPVFRSLLARMPLGALLEAAVRLAACATSTGSSAPACLRVLTSSPPSILPSPTPEAAATAEATAVVAPASAVAAALGSSQRRPRKRRASADSATPSSVSAIPAAFPTVSSSPTPGASTAPPAEKKPTAIPIPGYVPTLAERAAEAGLVAAQRAAAIIAAKKQEQQDKEETAKREKAERQEKLKLEKQERLKLERQKLGLDGPLMPQPVALPPPPELSSPSLLLRGILALVKRRVSAVATDGDTAAAVSHLRELLAHLRWATALAAYPPPAECDVDTVAAATPSKKRSKKKQDPLAPMASGMEGSHPTPLELLISVLLTLATASVEQLTSASTSTAASSVKSDGPTATMTMAAFRRPGSGVAALGIAVNLFMHGGPMAVARALCEAEAEAAAICPSRRAGSSDDEDVLECLQPVPPPDRPWRGSQL